jgi:hypothetical protein
VTLDVAKSRFGAWIMRGLDVAAGSGDRSVGDLDRVAAAGRDARCRHAL